MYRLSLFATIMISLDAPITVADVPFFQGLGEAPSGTFNSYAHGISADGSVVVGHNDSAAGHQAFRWIDDAGMSRLQLPDGSISGQAVAVTPSGSVVVGDVQTEAGWSAFRWTTGGGMTAIGAGYSARGVSDDGLTVVGYGSQRAARWNESNGWQYLDGWADWANDVSGDGTVIAGWGVSDDSSPHSEAFIWTENEGLIGLGDLPGGGYESKAHAVSADGSVVVGISDSASGDFGAFRWTAATGMEGLGYLPGASRSSAMAVSADGRIVVGASGASLWNKAYIWDHEQGIRDLQELLEDDFGLELDGWELNSADALSPDGRYIAGYGLNPAGDFEAWIAHIPEPSSLGLAVVGTLLVLRRRGTANGRGGRETDFRQTAHPGR